MVGQNPGNDLPQQELLRASSAYLLPVFRAIFGWLVGEQKSLFIYLSFISLFFKKLFIFIGVAQLVKNPPAMQETRFDSWVGKIHWRRDSLLTPVFLGFPGGSAVKDSHLQCKRPGFDPWVGNQYPGFDTLEKGMATHSSILAWRIP